MRGPYYRTLKHGEKSAYCRHSYSEMDFTGTLLLNLKWWTTGKAFTVMTLFVIHYVQMIWLSIISQSSRSSYIIKRLLRKHLDIVYVCGGSPLSRTYSSGHITSSTFKTISRCLLHILILLSYYKSNVLQLFLWLLWCFYILLVLPQRALSLLGTSLKNSLAQWAWIDATRVSTARFIDHVTCSKTSTHLVLQRRNILRTPQKDVWNFKPGAAPDILVDVLRLKC